MGTAERVPLPDVIIRAAIHQLRSRTATKLATGNAESDARLADEIERVLRKVHGGETALWMRRWRWFLLPPQGLFAYAGGSEWGTSHYRLKAP